MGLTLDLVYSDVSTATNRPVSTPRRRASSCFLNGFLGSSVASVIALMDSESVNDVVDDDDEDGIIGDVGEGNGESVVEEEEALTAERRFCVFKNVFIHSSRPNLDFLRCWCCCF